MKKNSKLRALLTAVVMVLPLAFGFVGNGVQAAEKDTQTVTLHKMAYDEMPEPTTPNTGDEMDFGGKPLAGAVFTAYDVTKEYWETYDTTEGTDGAKTDAAQARVLALTSLTGTSYEFAATDTNGEATLELPKKATDNDGKLRNAIYLFKETKSPAGVVQSKSIPFVLGLPIYNDKTDTEKEVVHVYPKNETEDLTLGFTKYGVEEDGKTNDFLAGAEFILKDKATGKYYTTETGKFTASEATASKIASDEKGKVTVTGLVLNPGTYEFYEVDSSVSTSKEQDVDAEEIFHYAKNPMVTATVDTDMNVTYNYYDLEGNLVENATGDAKAYNYKVPAPTKEASDHDVDTDQVFNFEITQLIPTDIADYTTFALVDTFDSNLQLVSTTEADLLSEIKASMTTEMAELVSGVTIDAANNTFTVNFDLEKVKANAGETISFKVQMSVKDGATWGGEIKNDITFDNNFHDKKDSDSVKTYGKKFLKIDADSENPLANAEFNVLNPEDKLLGTNADGKQVWGTKGDAGFTPLVVKSGEDGTFSVSGLAKTDAAGNDITYRLKEITAPDGYALAETPFDFVADDGTATLNINNKHKGSLPSTGGKGIVAFVAVGVVAIAGAGLYFMKGRKHIEG